MANYEPCSICEEYIEGVICDKDKCPVAIMKAEIERLKKENEDITNQYLTADMYYEDNESKAVKEFAERLCEGRVANDPVVIAVNCELKEMVGEKE